MFEKQIGIDLGTANVLVWVKGKGIVLQEPSVVALSTVDQKIIALGQEALEMLGRTPESIAVLRPMRDGVIADYMVAEAMLRYFVSSIVGPWRFFRPQMMLSVPVGVTSVEIRAVHDAAVQAGASVAYLIPEPLAAALGANLPTETATGNMVVNIGGGTSEAAVISLNEIVVASAVRVGGNEMDEAIAAYIRRKYNLIVGERTAEAVKIEIGSALPMEEEMRLEVHGRDQVSGLPRSVTIKTGEAAEAIAEPLAQVATMVKGVLEKTPPEMAADIIARGITLTGGGSLLRNIDRYLNKEMGVAVHLAENPIACVVLGAGKAMQDLHIYRRSLPEI